MRFRRSFRYRFFSSTFGLIASLIPMLGLGLLVASPARADAVSCWWVNVPRSTNVDVMVWAIPAGIAEVVATRNGASPYTGDHALDPEAGTLVTTYDSDPTTVVREVTADGSPCSYVGSPAAVPAVPDPAVAALSTAVAALPTTYPTPLATVAMDGDQYAELLSASEGGGGGTDDDPTVVVLSDDQFAILGGLISFLTILGIASVVYSHGKRSAV